MNPAGFVASRRAILTGALVGALAWASRPLLPRLQAQETEAAITAALVDRAPTEPDDPLWARTSAASITLNPQNVVLPRIEEAGAMAHEYQWEGVARYIDWRRQHQPEEGAANANNGSN